MAYLAGIHVCDNCDQVSDDGLVTVVTEPASRATWGEPGWDAETADWCAPCVANDEHHGVVTDDTDDAPDPDRDRDDN